MFLPPRSDPGDGFAARGSGWDSVSVRHAFIRKVTTRLPQPAVIRFPSLKSRVWVLNLTVLARVSQVYLVLASQLIVTTAIVSVFTFV